MKFGTIRRELGCLISALKNDEDNRRIDFVPKIWRPEEQPDNDHVFTRSEMAQILNAVRLGSQNYKRRHLRLFTLMAIYLGAGKTHILNVRWTDIDLVNSWVTWPKTRSKKSTPRRQKVDAACD